MLHDWKLNLHKSAFWKKGSLKVPLPNFRYFHFSNFSITFVESLIHKLICFFLFSYTKIANILHTILNLQCISIRWGSKAIATSHCFLYIKLFWNLYSANKECEQLNVLTTLCNFLSNITDWHCKNIVFGGDFNVFFDSNYEAQGCNPTLKKKSVAKLIHIKEILELCDIWRVRNSKKKRFTFRQRHNSGFIQRRLDYFLVSNILQESI